VCDLHRNLNLERTVAFQSFCNSQEEKLCAIDPEMYNTPALLTTEWMNADFRTRHAQTRFAVNGLHHVVCVYSGFHEPNELCICKLCFNPCEKYHAGKCIFVESITKLAKCDM